VDTAESPKVTVENGFMLCPDCETQINVGTVGIQNYLRQHKGSKQCSINKAKKAKVSPP